MWDTTSSLSGYDTVVVQIGNLAAAYGKPVLLLEGDSHIFSVDYPYSPSSPLHSKHPSTPRTPHLRRRGEATLQRSPGPLLRPGGVAAGLRSVIHCADKRFTTSD